MTATLPQSPTDPQVWIALGCLAIAATAWLVGRITPRASTLGVFIVAISTVIVLLIDIFSPTREGPVLEIARACAVLTLLWATVGALARRSAPTQSADAARAGALGMVASVVALLLGVVAACVQSVVLAMRFIFMIVDLLQGYPWLGVPTYGFGVGGLLSLGCLLAACLISLYSRRDRRLATCSWWCAILATCWAVLLLPTLQLTPVGGYQRTGQTAWLALALSIVSAVIVASTGEADRRRLRRLAQERPNERAQPDLHWPGLSVTIVLLGLVLILLVCYHLAVPIALTPGGFRATTLIATAAAWMAATATFAVARREWNISSADTGMGLASLGLCGLLLLCVPSKPETLAERYPLVFNAMMGGLALATGLWTWLSCVWRQQLDEGRAWITADRFVPAARHFAFLTAALALVIGAVMAVWPRLPGISATDDSLGRVCAGVSVNLLLLLVMLWCSRFLHKFSFQILTVLAVASTAGFLMARMMPFSPKFG